EEGIGNFHGSASLCWCPETKTSCQEIARKPTCSFAQSLPFKSAKQELRGQDDDHLLDALWGRVGAHERAGRVAWDFAPRGLLSPGPLAAGDRRDPRLPDLGRRYPVSLR